MTISSNAINSLTSISSLYASQSTKRTNSTEENKRPELPPDVAELSATGIQNSQGTQPPAPPEEMDFENMTDEEFKDYLAESQSFFGSLPGMSEEVDLDSLTDEELTTLRETFSQMAAEGPKQPPTDSYTQKALEAYKVQSSIANYLK